MVLRELMGMLGTGCYMHCMLGTTLSGYVTALCQSWATIMVS